MGALEAVEFGDGMVEVLRRKSEVGDQAGRPIRREDP
jgi:hypothetical protein